MVSALAGLAISAGASALGGILSGQAMEQAKGREAASHNYITGLLNGRRNSNYINRTEIQSALTKQRELLNEQYKRSRATNIVAGGNDAQLAVQKQLANQSVADSTSSIASGASQYKDEAEKMLMQENARYQDRLADYDRQKSSNIAKAGAGLAQAGGAMMSEGSWDWLMKKNGSGNGATA